MQSDPSRDFRRRGPRESGVQVGLGKSAACDLAGLQERSDGNDAGYGRLAAPLQGLTASGVSQLQHLRVQIQDRLRRNFVVPDSLSSDPAALPYLELYLHSHFSFAGRVQNSAASGWTDRSPHGRDALQGTGSLQPQVQSTLNTSPNGKTLLRFDGSDDFLSSDPFTFPTLSRGYTFYFYGRLRQVSAPFPVGIIFTDQATDAGPQIGYEALPDGPPFVRTNAGVLLGTTPVYGPWQLLTVVFRTDLTVQGYRALGGGDVIPLDLNPAYTFLPAASDQGYRLSGNVSGNGCIDADLAAVVWVSAQHDRQTIRQVRRFLAAEFGEE